MSKSTNFSGQPILNQLIEFLDKGEIKRIAGENCSEKYVKKFNTYHHVIVMLFVALEGYHSIREVVLGLMSNAHKLIHVGLRYIVRRSTLSEANIRRSSKVFGQIYQAVYTKHGETLADSPLSNRDIKRLFIMDSTTISLFNDILKGAGRNPKEGRKKGGIKAHTIIKADEKVPYLIRYSEAAKHDHTFLKEVNDLPKDSIVTFDKGYVDYKQYQLLTEASIYYVTRLKDNAKYKAGKEHDIADTTDCRVLKDEEIILNYGENKKEEHRARRIAYWDGENNRLFEFITNNFELAPERIALIYKYRWKIELLFKQLKQNFPLKYFLGDSQNAIEIQIWSVMIANLLIMLVKSRIKRSWAFSNIVSLIRRQLMSYNCIYKFLQDPEGSWNEIIKANEEKYANSLFPLP